MNEEKKTKKRPRKSSGHKTKKGADRHWSKYGGILLALLAGLIVGMVIVRKFLE